MCMRDLNPPMSCNYVLNVWEMTHYSYCFIFQAHYNTMTHSDDFVMGVSTMYY